MASSNPNAITCLQRLETLDIQDGIYIRTRIGWLYLAVVLDLYARKVVGWAMAPTMHAELVCAALQLAIAQRQPAPGLIVHSDRGSQGEFKQSTQHLNQGGVRWVDRRGGYQNGQGARRCARQAVRKSING